MSIFAAGKKGASEALVSGAFGEMLVNGSVRTCSIWSVVSRPPFLDMVRGLTIIKEDRSTIFKVVVVILFFFGSSIFEEFHEQSFKHCLGSLAGIIFFTKMPRSTPLGFIKETVLLFS